MQDNRRRGRQLLLVAAKCCLTKWKCLPKVNAIPTNEATKAPDAVRADNRARERGLHR